MVQAYDLYGKWLKSMMHSLKLDEDKLGVGGRDIFDNIIGKKNKQLHLWLCCFIFSDIVFDYGEYLDVQR